MTPFYALKVAIAQAERMGLNNSHVHYMQWAEGYADGTEAPKGIAYGDWNDDDTYSKEKGMRVKTSNLPSRLCRIFERMGVEIEWDDMVSTCDDCGLLIRTEPDCYSWAPDFIVGDGFLKCMKCAKNDSDLYCDTCEEFIKEGEEHSEEVCGCEEEDNS
jgi:hypothetical protein